MEAQPPRTRSRTGCSQCVNVSRKCDETHPICVRCRRLGFACDYTPRLIWKKVKIARASTSLSPVFTPLSRAVSSKTPTATTATIAPSAAPLRPTSPRPRMLLGSPLCNCPSRKTEDELYELFITNGSRLLNWDHEEAQSPLQDVVYLCWQFPTIRDEVNALMSLHVQCCRVSSLASVDRAITETIRFLTSTSAIVDPKVSVFTMILLSQISMRAGYAWTHHLPQILSFALARQANLTNAMETDIWSPQNVLETLGGLDMDVWILGRQSKPIHIWATYCSGRQGIERVTGLPRPLLDLIARLSRYEDVADELQELLSGLPHEPEDYARNVQRSFALAALLQLHSRVRPVPGVELLIKDLLHMVGVLRTASASRFNQRVLIWPAYVVGCYVRDVKDMSLVEDTLLQARILGGQLTRGSLAPEESVLVMLRRFWKDRLLIGDYDAFQRMQAQIPEVGLW
ncbi:hypothetical protein AJ78_04369 [Emergomyces pasteurianus Ep9510]|uniref:Zn(2)-C6 fungal-type domain-containing protein n=1 Tax=Emergomyces pasteurianus Ep9510 TaxID=1447872 RepID=A0A1J9QHH3_9EURO|nr:hypothetical protein AJ78_04369 [Emergomyces pasteurianus Ep9510]